MCCLLGLQHVQHTTFYCYASVLLVVTRSKSSRLGGGSTLASEEVRGREEGKREVLAVGVKEDSQL